MNIISSFSSVRMSALCAFSALLMLSCQDNIEPENGKDDPGKPDDTEEPVDPPVESTDPALTAFTPLSGSNGAEVTLTGKNFGTDASAVKVYFIDTDLQKAAAFGDRVIFQRLGSESDLFFVHNFFPFSLV